MCALLNIDSSISRALESLPSRAPPLSRPCPGHLWLPRVGVLVHLLVCYRAPLVSRSLQGERLKRIGFKLSNLTVTLSSSNRRGSNTMHAT